MARKMGIESEAILLPMFDHDSDERRDQCSEHAFDVAVRLASCELEQLVPAKMEKQNRCLVDQGMEALDTQTMAVLLQDERSRADLQPWPS